MTTTLVTTPATVPMMCKDPAVLAAVLCSRIVSSFPDAEPVHLAPDLDRVEDLTTAEGPRRGAVATAP